MSRNPCRVEWCQSNPPRPAGPPYYTCKACSLRWIRRQMERHEEDDRLCTCRDNRNSTSGLCFAFQHKGGLCYSHWHQRECAV